MKAAELALLTDKQKRIRIAELAGCVEVSVYSDGHSFCKKPRPSDGELSIYPVPDYLNDLNAMHEACAQFEGNDGKCLIYNMFLHKVCNEPLSAFPIINATAAQRAAAFLLTLG